jgi:hypothetical protein
LVETKGSSRARTHADAAGGALIGDQGGAGRGQLAQADWRHAVWSEMTERPKGTGALAGTDVGHPAMVEARQEQQPAARDGQSTHVVDMGASLVSPLLVLTGNHFDAGIDLEKAVCSDDGRCDSLGLRAARSDDAELRDPARGDFK